MRHAPIAVRPTSIQRSHRGNQVHPVPQRGLSSGPGRVRRITAAVACHRGRGQRDTQSANLQAAMTKVVQRELAKEAAQPRGTNGCVPRAGAERRSCQGISVIFQDRGPALSCSPSWRPVPATRSTPRRTTASTRRARVRERDCMRRKPHLLGVLLVLAFGLLGTTAWAQTQTGHRRGEGRRPTGRTPARRHGHAHRPAGVARRLSPTTEGNYRFVGVQPATYSLKAELTGFIAKEIGAIAVGMARTSTVDVTMQLASAHRERRGSSATPRRSTSGAQRPRRR